VIAPDAGMTRSLTGRRAEATALPDWVKPQLTKLVDDPPEGSDWLHEIKYDGYRMHARLDRGAVRLLTRTGLDWSHKYPAIAAAVASLPARQAYFDGELCGVRPDGTTSFSLIQNASDTGKGDALVFFLFDLLHLDGEAIGTKPIKERKERLHALLSDATAPVQFSDHQIGRGRAFYDHACALKLEGIVSKRIDAPYAPGNRGLWLKVKCLNREEFVVVGWTDPEGARPWLGRCCSPTTTRMAGWCMPAAPAPALAMRNFSACGAASSRWRRPTCRSTSRRRATAGSARRSF
jgi:bifunctional non-homologous end joining protein LigD